MAQKVLTATALALLLGVSAAAAQSGGEARSNDRKMEKALDNRELTPIRPIRRVGEDNWPAATNQPAVTQETSAQNKPRETTGQASKEAPKEADHSAKQEPKSDPVKQDAAKQDTPKQEPAKQDTAQDKSQDKQDFASIRLGTDKNGRVSINDAQERQISSSLRKQHIQTVDVAVTIGAVTPASVRLGAVSADIVAVLPQFRGYSYFATRENIVIVEPDNKKIVALVPVQVTATASRSRETTTEPGSTTSRVPRSSATVTRRETTGSAVAAEVPSEEEILASPVVTAPSRTTVTRTYRAASEPVIIEHRRRPRIFGLW